MTIPFTPVSLEVDEALWGGFWHGDVISPGYTLPALESAFLRETRLTESISLPTPADYLAALQQALKTPAREIEPVSLENIAAQKVVGGGWVVWVLAEHIAAGYPRPPQPVPAPLLHYAQLILSRRSQWREAWHNYHPAAKIDRLIQLHRALCVTNLSATATD